MLTPELENIFKYHKPVGDQPGRYELIRSEALKFAKIIQRTCPESAEKTKAIRKLQSTVMWANASIALNPK